MFTVRVNRAAGKLSFKFGPELPGSQAKKKSLLCSSHDQKGGSMQSSSKEIRLFIKE